MNRSDPLWSSTSVAHETRSAAPTIPLLFLAHSYVTDIDRAAGRNRDASLRRRRAAENDECPRTWWALDLKSPVGTAERTPNRGWLVHALERFR